MRLMDLLTGKENFGEQFALLLLSVPPSRGRRGKNRSGFKRNLGSCIGISHAKQERLERLGTCSEALHSRI